MKRKTKRAMRYGGWAFSRVVFTVLKVFGTMILIFITTGAMLLGLTALYVSQNMDVDVDINLDDFTLNQASFVYYIDRSTGEEVQLDTYYDKENRVFARFDEVPKHMVEALIAIEDKRFWSHSGVDWARTVHAFANMFSGGRSFGGSSITQQLVKNLYQEKEITVRRKINEMLRAMEYEKKYTKERILEWYLNTSYFGQGCWGVKTAAKTYFGKELSELTLPEAACIIGITNSPTRYNPFLYPEYNKERQETILTEMRDQGYISDAEYEEAVNTQLVFTPENKPSERSDRSYFVDQVFDDVVSDLMEQKGFSIQMAQSLVFGGGLKIYATIDPELQAIVDDCFVNNENFPVVRDTGTPQAAMVLMDPYSGDVLAMAGGRGEKSGLRVFNRATSAYRQPGSAIKPVGVYAPALENNIITPYSVLDDAPFRLSGDTAWPRNSNRRYRGLTTIMSGVTNSTNTIAARTLDMLTPQASFSFLTEKVGVTTLNQNDLDYAPLSLGGLNKGISVLELTAAYTIFDNRGVYVKPRTYFLVKDSKGNVILDNQPQTTMAISEKNAWYMNNMLQSVTESGTGSAAKLENMPTAGKTGTTTTDKDRWFVGYTPYYLAGVWFGYDNPKPIKLEQTVNPALSLWKQVMERVHEDLPRREFFSIDNVVSASYCRDSGLKPGEGCALDPRGNRVATGQFYKDDVPQGTCNKHRIVDLCGESGELATPFCPAETRKKVALLDHTRSLPASGVVIEDDYYTFRYEFRDGKSVLINQDTTSGFPPVSLTASEGTVAPNRYCHIHTVEVSVSPEPETSPPPESTSPWPTDDPYASHPPIELPSLPPEDEDAIQAF